MENGEGRFGSRGAEDLNAARCTGTSHGLKNLQGLPERLDPPQCTVIRSLQQRGAEEARRKGLVSCATVGTLKVNLARLGNVGFEDRKHAWHVCYPWRCLTGCA